MILSQSVQPMIRHQQLRIQEWHVISDQTAFQSQPNQLAQAPRDPLVLAVDGHSVGTPLSVPVVSRPGMINSLPMVSQSKCRPARPPPCLESNQPRSFQFYGLTTSSCRPIPLVYEHHPPGPGEKRQKMGMERATRSSATTVIRTETPSSIQFLVQAWISILTELGTLSRVFADIGSHANRWLVSFWMLLLLQLCIVT